MSWDCAGLCGVHPQLCSPTSGSHAVGLKLAPIGIACGRAGDVLLCLGAGKGRWGRAGVPRAVAS
eukprot:361635-Chlamydomonas_euryale.AAC.5